MFAPDPRGRRPWTAFVNVLRSVKDPTWRRRIAGRILARLALVLVIAPVAIATAISFTPGQTVDALGQHLTVKVRPLTWSISGPGEFILGNKTPMDMKPTNIIGPLRPQISTVALTRNEALGQAVNPKTAAESAHTTADALAGGFLAWFLMATIVVAIIALVMYALIAWFRGKPWRRELKGMAAVLVGVLTIWIILAVFAVTGSQALSQVKTLDDLVGHGVIHLSPQPLDHQITGYQAVVMGDSRAARVGGKPLAKPTEDDKACERSADSLAGLIGQYQDWNVLNLACSRASIRTGLMGPQSAGGRIIPAQMSVVKSMKDLKLVVVMIGPNDLNWSDTLKFCYGLEVCNDNLTTAYYSSVRDQFAWDYADLLTELRDSLSPTTQVIVNLSYDVFDGDASCPDALDINGHPLGQDKIDLFKQRNAELNSILSTASQYGFDVARTSLRLLCTPDTTGTGPDLLGLHDSHAFHPTQMGEVLIAKTDVDLIKSG